MRQMSDSTKRLAEAVGEMLRAYDCGPDYWQAVSLLLIALYQERLIRSMVNMALSAHHFALSKSMTSDEVLKSLDPRAIDFFLDAVLLDLDLRQIPH